MKKNKANQILNTYKGGFFMKKTKLLSALTALTLTAVSAVSTVASAEDNSYLYWTDRIETIGCYEVRFWSNSATDEEYCQIASCNDKTLTEAVIPDEIEGVPVKSVYSELFKDFDNLTSVDFGKNKKQLNEAMFRDCDALVEVTLPEWLPYIPEGIFENCSNLKKVVMTSEKCNAIYGMAFKNCTSLETVIIPHDENAGGITVVAEAFYNCDSLESIDLPACDLMYPYVFAGCDNLKSVTVGGEPFEFSTEIEPTEIISTDEEETTVTSYETAPDLLGDANCDGTVNVSDAMAIAEFVASNGEKDLPEMGLINGDVFNTGDGLNASDAFMIQQYATGVIDTL